MQDTTRDNYEGRPPERKQVVADNPPTSGSPNHMGWTFYSVARETARQAPYVTLIEVQKEKADRQIKRIEAHGPGQITVTLTNGRTHTWWIDGLSAEKDRPSSSPSSWWKRVKRATYWIGSK